MFLVILYSVYFFPSYYSNQLLSHYDHFISQLWNAVLSSSHHFFMNYDHELRDLVLSDSTIGEPRAS